jgi:hypothetical protein
LSRWENDSDKNKNIKTDGENGTDNKKSDMLEDKPDVKPPGKPVYEDKGPPGHEDQVDTPFEIKSDPALSPPPPPTSIKIDKQAEIKPSNEAIFGNTTPLFDEPGESAPIEQKSEVNNEIADA